MRLPFLCSLLLAKTTRVRSHGAVSTPRPRNAIDGNIAPWNGTVPGAMPFMFWCTVPDSDANDPRNLTGRNGQACFWFNNGCDISCDQCDGQTGQVIHPKFIYTGANISKMPSWGGEGIIHDPNQTWEEAVSKRPDGQYRASICAKPKRNATLCDPALRTMNINAECGGPEDYTYYAPWRYPGSSPVIDACGVAGGVIQGQHPAKAGGDYQPTENAQLGDRGSKLPAQPSGAVWNAGEEVEVAWVHKAWHGGGYSYRLCKADQELTEACFQATPLNFASSTSSLRWGGSGGEQIWFTASDVSKGTIPQGSTWRKCPIPRAPWGYWGGGASFQPVCEETPECRDAHMRPPTPLGHGSSEGAFPCKCSGWGIGDLYNLEIIDTLKIPDDLPAGEYVLGWRWDCEESTQVWASCSDITITNQATQ